MAAIVRLPDWWHSKLPPLLAIAYLGIAGPPGIAAAAPGRSTVRLLLFLVSALATAAWGHLLNDLTDTEQDLRAGKPSPVASGSSRRAILLIALFFALAILPWFLLAPHPLALGAFVLELLLLFAYAAPPVRLKERGFAGLLADALYGHALPMAIVIGLFGIAFTTPEMRANPRWAVSAALALVLWKLVQGLCGALASQIADRKNDRRSGARTWLSRAEAPRALAARRVLLRVLFPTQLGLFLLTLAILAEPWPLLFVSYILFLAAKLFQIHGVWKRTASFYRRGYPGYALLNDFHERWLPLLALGLLVAKNAAFVPVAGAHLLLFRNGLGDLIDPLRRGAKR